MRNPVNDGKRLTPPTLEEWLQPPPPEANESGIFSVYSTVGGERFFHGTVDNLLAAKEWVRALCIEQNHDTAYVKQFGVGTVFHSGGE